MCPLAVLYVGVKHMRRLPLHMNSQELANLLSHNADTPLSSIPPLPETVYGGAERQEQSLLRLHQIRSREQGWLMTEDTALH